MGAAIDVYETRIWNLFTLECDVKPELVFLLAHVLPFVVHKPCKLRELTKEAELVFWGVT